MGQRRAEENDQGTSIPKMQPRTDHKLDRICWRNWRKVSSFNSLGRKRWRQGRRFILIMHVRKFSRMRHLRSMVRSAAENSSSTIAPHFCRWWLWQDSRKERWVSSISRRTTSSEWTSVCIVLSCWASASSRVRLCC